MTQEQLADAISMTKGTISRLEAGEIGYTQQTLEAIADALSVHPSLLLARAPAEHDHLPNEAPAKRGKKRRAG